MASSDSSSLPDAHAMIALFRVAELKTFLKSLNVSTGGRKKQLQDRAIKLIETGNPKITSTLVQLYKSTFPSGSTRALPKPPVSHSTTNPPPFHVKHPDVKFKSHAFYQHIDCVYRTTAMESSSYMKKAMSIQFHLTPQHIRHIFDSETTPGNYRTQVILRFCKNETSCEQEDYYPGNCYISINNQSCPIPGYNPNYSMRPEYKRQGKPINITTYIHTSAAVVNTLTFTWSHDIIHSQGFCFAIDLMTCLSPPDLLQKLKGKGTRSADVSKAMIKDKLLIDMEAEISTTSLRISLLCPLSKTRIGHPCKSTSCDHLQCFDASTYLQMNERKPKWVCPVCDRPAPFTDLLIDGYLFEICQKSTEDLIEFTTDGCWHSVDKNPNKDKIVSLTPPSSITIMDSPQYATTGNILKKFQQESTEVSGVIDLTLESDDDDNEQILDIIRSQSRSSESGSGMESEDNESPPKNKRVGHFSNDSLSQLRVLTSNELPFRTGIQDGRYHDTVAAPTLPLFDQRPRMDETFSSLFQPRKSAVSSTQSSTRVPVISYSHFTSSNNSNSSSTSTAYISHACTSSSAASTCSLHSYTGPTRTVSSDLFELYKAQIGELTGQLSSGVTSRNLTYPRNVGGSDSSDDSEDVSSRHQRRKRKRPPTRIHHSNLSRGRVYAQTARLYIPTVPYISGCSPILSASSSDSS